MLHRPSIRWTLASFVLIGGGIGLVTLALVMFSVTDPWAGHTAYFIGALVGGFTVARASRGITIVEPALGGFLLTGVLFGLFGLSPGSAFIWPEDTALWHRALSLGLVSLVGGMTGSVAGERFTARYPTSANPWRMRAWQSWVGLLSFAGCVLALWVILLIITQQARDEMFDSVSFVIPSFLIGTIASGAVAQAMHREPMYFASGGGPPLFLFGLIVIATLRGAPPPPGMLLLMLLGGMTLGSFAALGAAVGDRVGHRWRASHGEDGDLPAARIATQR